MKKLCACYFFLIFPLILIAGDFRVSGDGTMKVFYFNDKIAMFRDFSNDIDGKRFWYSLDKAGLCT